MGINKPNPDLHVADLIYTQNLDSFLVPKSSQEVVIAKIESIKIIRNSSKNLVHFYGVVSAENTSGDAYPDSAKVTYRLYRNHLSTKPIYIVEEFLGQTPRVPLPDTSVDIDLRDNTPINFVDKINPNDSCNGIVNYYLTAEANTSPTSNAISVDNYSGVDILGPVTLTAVYYYNK